MKNLILTVAAMIMAATSMAQNSGYVNIVSVTPTAEQDKLMYISPNDTQNESARTQKIVTSTGYIPGFPIAFSMQHFLVECVASSEDFNKGVTENVYLLNGAVKAMPVMPARAKVVGLALPGNYDDTGLTNRQFVYNLYSYLFIKNLNEEPSNNPPYKDVFYSDLLKENIGGFGDDRYFYKPENNYLQAISKGNRRFRAIDPPKDAEHPYPYVLDMTFDSPFQYDGDFIHLAIELTPISDENPEQNPNNATRFYFPNTQSSFSNATIYHTKREGGTITSEFNFYSDPQSKANVITGLKFYLKETNPDLSDFAANIAATTAANNLFNYFNFQDYTLPAFQLTYYTNDIRGTVLDINPDPEGNPKPIEEDIEADNVDTELQPNGRPLIRLYDETDKKYIKPDGVDALNSVCGAEVNEDGSFCFSNLDHTHVYTLSAASSTCGYQEKTINFDTGISQAKALDVNNAFKNDLVCDIRMLQDPDVPTAITDVATSASPVAVEYYNVAGVRSATPFKGVNIVVTQYSDGSRTTKKIVK